MCANAIYEPLATSLKSDGFTLLQIERQNMVAIYLKTKANYYRGYEVIIIRNREQFEIKGRIFSPAEIYPSSGAWGTHGWTYQTLEAAKKKFNSLLEALIPS